MIVDMTDLVLLPSGSALAREWPQLIFSLSRSWSSLMDDVYMARIATVAKILCEGAMCWISFNGYVLYSARSEEEEGCQHQTQQRVQPITQCVHC